MITEVTRAQDMATQIVEGVVLEAGVAVGAGGDGAGQAVQAVIAKALRVAAAAAHIVMLLTLPLASKPSSKSTCA